MKQAHRVIRPRTVERLRLLAQEIGGVSNLLQQEGYDAAALETKEAAVLLASAVILLVNAGVETTGVSG